MYLMPQEIPGSGTVQFWSNHNAGVLSAGAASLRQLPRTGDEALAARHPAQYLQHAVRPGAARGTLPEAEGLEETAEAPLWQEPQPSPEAELLRHQDEQAIRRLVAALPSVFREIIVLRDINELSYREIADVAGVPVGTVMSRLARARRCSAKPGTSNRDRRHELLRIRSADPRAARRRT